MLEMELLTIRLWFKYIMIKMLHWLNGNFLCFVCMCVLVCAICDGRQRICENQEDSGIFRYLHIYSHPGTAGFSVWNYYVQSKLHRGRSISLPLSLCIGPQIYLLWSSLCQLTFFGGGGGRVVSWQLHGSRMALLIHLVVARLDCPRRP